MLLGPRAGGDPLRQTFVPDVQCSYRRRPPEGRREKKDLSCPAKGEWERKSAQGEKEGISHPH